MASLPPVYAELRANTAQFDAAMGGARRQVSGFERQGKQSFSRFAGYAKVAAAAAGVALVAFASKSVKAYAEAEQAQKRLSDAYEKFPALADVSIDKLRELNEQLALKTRFDDDATASGQAVLAQFGLTGKQLAAVTPLLQDYAAKTGKDLPSAAKDLGKAVLGQGRALKNIGLDFTDTGTKAGNLKAIMSGLRSQVGGFATNEGATAAGRAQILKNQFGELQESVGSLLVPALSRLVGWLSTAITWLRENKGAAKALAVVIGTTLVAAVVLYTASMASAAVATIAATWPFLLAVAAAVAWAAAIYLLWQRSEKFRRVIAVLAPTVGAMVAAVSRLIAIMVSAFTGGLASMLDAAAKAARVLGFDSLADKLSGAASTIDAFSTVTVAKLNALAAKAEIAGVTIGRGIMAGIDAGLAQNPNSGGALTGGQPVPANTDDMMRVGNRKTPAEKAAAQARKAAADAAKAVQAAVGSAGAAAGGGGGGGSASSGPSPAERAADRAIRQAEKAVAAARKTRDAMRDALRAARDNLKGVQDTIRDYVNAARDGMRQFGGIFSTPIIEGLGVSSGSIIANMQGKVAQAREFAAIVKKLRGAGLNNVSLDEIIKAGPADGLQIARALLDGGIGAVNQVNTLEAQLGAFGSQAGQVGANALYGNQLVNAQGKVTVAVENKLQADIFLDGKELHLSTVKQRKRSQRRGNGD